MTDDPPGAPGVVDWTPSRTQWTWINLAGLALTALGLVGYLAAWAVPRGATGARFGLTGVVVALVATAVLMVVHELVHGLALLTLGHRPTFGVARVDRVVVGLTTTATGARMSKPGFCWVALAPMVLLSALTLWWAADGPMGGAAVVPGAIHLGGCIGDLALVARALRTPPGSLIEDRQTGIRIHPAGAAP